MQGGPKASSHDFWNEVSLISCYGRGVSSHKVCNKTSLISCCYFLEGPCRKIQGPAPLSFGIKYCQ